MPDIRFPWDSEPPAPPPALPTPVPPPAKKPRGRRPAAASQAKMRQQVATLDWIYHHLTLSGPAKVVEDFAWAARGAGVVPRASDGVGDKQAIMQWRAIMCAGRADSEQFSGVAHEQDGLAANMPEQHSAVRYVPECDALIEVRVVRLRCVFDHCTPPYSSMRQSRMLGSPSRRPNGQQRELSVIHAQLAARPRPSAYLSLNLRRSTSAQYDWPSLSP
jgi:hypothetical protein